MLTLLAEEQILTRFIWNGLHEDIGDGDHTSLACIPSESKGKAQMIVKEDGIISGLEIAVKIFNEVDDTLRVELFAVDGTPVSKGDVVLKVAGSVHSILKAERLVLNVTQHMSGIATMTKRVSSLLKDTKTKVLDTRKTTPGMRFIEKQAVVTGGGKNHRHGLYDMILIKDNHIDFSGGIAKAIHAANQYLIETDRGDMKIEIEARNLNEVKQILETGHVHRIMLDNFNFEDLKTAVQLIGGRFETEASGGITESNVRAYADCGVDYISMGALTHSVKNLDISLKAC